MNNSEKQAIFDYHRGGKISLGLPRTLETVEELCLAYTPGVAEAVREIARVPESIMQYTAKSNMVAVVTDGTAILGLGDLGPGASIPVMEGKAVLFKVFADVNGWPVPLDNCRVGGQKTGRTDPQRVIDATLAIAPMYGGINLEDIAAPACFEIEDRLDELLDIPVFHDDQWGTAVITLAGLLNYAELSKRDPGELRVVINGCGAAGTRIHDMLRALGVQQIVMCDSRGVVYRGRPGLEKDPRRAALAVETSARTTEDALVGAHVFIGVSVADCVEPEAILEMSDYPAIFAMSNPDPEIRPQAVAQLLAGRQYVMATGRSDYPNQVNNVLCFPFLFRGALDCGASSINMPMKLAAARALAAAAKRPAPELVKRIYAGEDLDFGNNYVIPKPFDRELFVEVAYAVAEAAVDSGIARMKADALPALKEALVQRNANRS